MKRTTIALIIMSTIIFSSFALGKTEISGFAPSQADENRIVSKEIQLSIGTQIIKGSNSDGVQLIFSRSEIKRLSNVSRGSAEVSFPTNETIQITGELNNTQSYFVRKVRTFAQKDSYIENVTVGEKVRRTYQDQNTTPSTMISVDQTFDLPFTYDDLETNENYTKVVRRGIVLFVSRTGGMTDIPVNDSNGNEIGRLLAFRFQIHIAAFLEETQEFVANYRSNEFGYGNLIPDAVRNRVRNGTSLPNMVDRQVIGQDQLNSTKPSVEWIDLGHNATYDLNMSMGIFRFNRHAKLILIAPIRNRPLDYTQIQAIDSDFEGLIDSYAAAYELQELDTMEIDDLDLTLVDEAITAENFDLAVATNGKQLVFNFAFFLLPFVISVPIMRREKNK